jgi:hypothetical protein
MRQSTDARDPLQQVSCTASIIKIMATVANSVSHGHSDPRRGPTVESDAMVSCCRFVPSVSPSSSVTMIVTCRK